MVITNTQYHSTKLELGFSGYSHRTRGITAKFAAVVPTAKKVSTFLSQLLKKLVIFTKSKINIDATAAKYDDIFNFRL